MNKPCRIPLDGGSFAELEVSPGLRIIRLLRPWIGGELRIVAECRVIGTVLDDMRAEGDQAVIDLLPTIADRAFRLNMLAQQLREAAEALELAVTGKVGD